MYGIITLKVNSNSLLHITHIVFVRFASWITPSFNKIIVCYWFKAILLLTMLSYSVNIIFGISKHEKNGRFEYGDSILMGTNLAQTVSLPQSLENVKIRADLINKLNNRLNIDINRDLELGSKTGHSIILIERQDGIVGRYYKINPSVYRWL